MNQALTFVFVHGLSGWGSYDSRYRTMPYWGMRGGDLMTFLRSSGFDCYAASVSPAGSAWDRACELYAQLAGTQTDYGAVHSGAYRHARFGPDFSGRPLIPSWDAQTRLVLLGHSFGGVTFAEANLTFVCRKLYQGEFRREGLADSVNHGIYKDWHPHWMFVGEIVATEDKR